jgi:cytosine/adenosine deaminase-related metal-dependent hydrolase
MIYDNATIITMDPHRRVITNGALRVEGAQIAAVGKSRDILPAFPQEPRFDCQGGVLMPGLVDTHVHTAQAMLRGCADDLALLDWLTKRVWVLQGNYTEDDGRASAELCLLEMIKSGTTSFIECMLAERYGFDGVAETVVRSGMKAALGKIVMDLPSYAKSESVMYPGMVEDGETGIRNTLTAYDRWNGAAEGRIQVWFGLRSPGGVTPSLYDRVAGLAKERSMGITVHLSEVRTDLDFATSQGFRSPIAFANQHGLLGPRTVLAHCVWTDEGDWQLMADTGTHVTHNPASNAKCASGIAPVKGMLASGVNVALGCDGGPSNNTYDLLRDLRLASYLAKLREDDPTAVPCETVLEMATINGARAMGLEDQIGSLEPGKRADFIVIDMDAPHLVPAWDPVSTIVCCACGSDVDTVVIDGKMVMQHRQVLTLDEASIIENVRSRYRKVGERAGLNIGPRWPTI